MSDVEPGGTVPEQEQRVAVVTGAGRGIGAAIAERLGADGLVVACLDIDDAGAQQTATLLEGQGVTAAAFAADVSDEDAVEQDAAGAAAPRVAADVRARQVEVVAQEVHEEPARRHLLLDLLAVHGHGHELARRRLGRHAHPFALSAAWRTARTTEVSARLRR